MGFNIGVTASIESSTVEINCDKFIDRRFYNWIVEYHAYKKESCIFQTGKYFNIDITPLTKVAYCEIEDEDDFDEILSIYSQKTDFLIELLQKLINSISNNLNYIQEINYANFRQQHNYWKDYVLKERLVEDLETLKESVTCFQKNGFKKVVLMAM